MLRNLKIALISAFFLSLLLAAFSYTPVLSRFPNSSYLSFKNYLMLFLIYSIPVYIVASVFFGYIIKILNNKFNTDNKYLVNIVWYAASGIITGVIVLISITQHDFYIFPFLTLCVLASLIFYHLSLLFKRLGC